MGYEKDVGVDSAYDEHGEKFPSHGHFCVKFGLVDVDELENIVLKTVQK